MMDIYILVTTRLKVQEDRCLCVWSMIRVQCGQCGVLHGRGRGPASLYTLQRGGLLQVASGSSRDTHLGQHGAGASLAFVATVVL